MRPYMLGYETFLRLFINPFKPPWTHQIPMPPGGVIYVMAYNTHQFRALAMHARLRREVDLCYLWPDQGPRLLLGAPQGAWVLRIDGWRSSDNYLPLAQLITLRRHMVNVADYTLP